LRPPRAYLDLDRDEIAAFCRSRDPFILSGTWIRPFERLQFLRTTEQTMMDLVERPEGFRELLRRIHQFNLDEAESWARTEVDALTVMDDWGSQGSLLIHPSLWRRIFKPLYGEYAAIARHFHKKIFIHSDGFIVDILGDLLEIGYDAVNSQIFCMGAERLRPFRGKITFWGEIDRQRILPYGTLEEVETAVRSVYDHLYLNGGVIAQCEFGPGAKPDNVELVFRTWEALRGAAVTVDSGNGNRP
jgi:uroporphyrinogen decarboxylase